MGIYSMDCNNWLAVIIMFFTEPSVNDTAAISDVLGEDVLLGPGYNSFKQDAVLYSVIQLTLLVFIVVLSVIKPLEKK